MELREKAAQLPTLPGVYLYKDAHGTVIYVGKAKNLRSRVRSYFLEARSDPTAAMRLALGDFLFPVGLSYLAVALILLFRRVTSRLHWRVLSGMVAPHATSAGSRRHPW